MPLQVLQGLALGPERHRAARGRQGQQRQFFRNQLPEKRARGRWRPGTTGDWRHRLLTRHASTAPPFTLLSGQ